MTLVLEPEAAAMCCKCIEAKKGDNDESTMFSAGSRFLIIDLGGMFLMEQELLLPSGAHIITLDFFVGLVLLNITLNFLCSSL